MTIFRAYNWHSVPKQLRSVDVLLRRDFVHVLPGHGRRHSFETAGEKDNALRYLLQEEGYVVA